MPYSERTVVKAIEINVQDKTIHVSWGKQVLRGSEVLAETVHRKAYTSQDRDQFVSDLPEYAMCADAFEWDETPPQGPASTEDQGE